MGLLFKVLAVILAGIAAYFLWSGNKDGAFIAVVCGAVAFFLSVRFQVRERLNQRAAEREEEELRREEEDFEEEIDDSPLLNEMPASEQIQSEKQKTGKELL